MEVTPEQARAHGEMSRYSLEFLRYVQKNPALTTRTAYHPELDTGDSHRVLNPFPTLISTAKRRELETVAVEVYRLLTSLPRRFFNFDVEKISRYCNISPEEVEISLYGVDDFQMDCLMARGDFVWTPSGLKCIEYNVNTNLGCTETTFGNPRTCPYPLSGVS